MAVAGRSTREQARSRRVCSLNRRRRPCRSVVASLVPPFWEWGAGDLRIWDKASGHFPIPPDPHSPSSLSTNKRFIQSDQLLLAREVDLDAPAFSFADDANARAELNLEFLFRGARVDVGRRGRA